MSERVLIYNATGFLKSSSVMYSFGDIKLSNPVPVTKALYIVGFLIAWCGPIIYIFGLHFSLPYILFLLVPPIIASQLATNPVFQGRTIIEFAQVMAQWAAEPRGSLDWVADDMKEPVYEVGHEYFISRRRDLQLLADIIEGKVKIETEEELKELVES